MLKCMIFDLDGTIGNTLPLCIAAFKQAIEPLAGRVLSDQEIMDTFGPSEEGTIRALIPDHYERGLTNYLIYYQKLHSMCPAPFDGLIQIFDDAKKQHVRLALVTGKGARSAEITLQVFGIASYFDAIETGSPAGPNKARGIQRVLHRLNIAPDQSFYVGDTTSDIKAARSVGVPMIAAAWAETTQVEPLRALNPEKLCTTIEEFKRYVEGMVD